MPVISTTYVVDTIPQPNNRIYVRETHTLSVGEPIINEYLGRVGQDFADNAARFALAINEKLKEEEMAYYINKMPDDLTFIESTPAEFATYFWTILRRAFWQNDKPLYHKMVWRLWKWVTDGKLTNEQVRVSFNNYFGTNYASGSQWNTFIQNRMVPIKDRYLAMMSETEM